MMQNSKIDNVQPEPQPNDAVKADELPSAQVAQNPVLPAVLSPRTRPCLCCCCPTCGAVFMATALNKDYHCDDESNRELLNDITDYAKQGYLITAKDASEFHLDYCEHLKANKI